MWLFTPIGFFSIVQKQGDQDSLTVRARVAGDLEALRKNYLPSLSSTMATPQADYAFRATASRQAVAEAMTSMAMSIDYDNFKDEVARTQGGARAAIYEKVWGLLRNLPIENDRLTQAPEEALEEGTKKPAAGKHPSRFRKS